jgi:hypothetical protein
MIPRGTDEALHRVFVDVGGDAGKLREAVQSKSEQLSISPLPGRAGSLEEQCGDQLSN